MSAEANKQIVLAFSQHMAAGEYERAFALLAPDATWWIPGNEVGGVTFSKEVMRGAIVAYLGAFERPPVMELHRITAEGDRVSLEQTSRGGRTRGGASYGNDYHLLFRFRDGLIAEVREYMNPLLGAALAAEIGIALDEGGGDQPSS